MFIMLQLNYNGVHEHCINVDFSVIIRLIINYFIITSVF